MKLAGKVAIVTGGGDGIGRATALLLAKEGADVMVADINAATAASVADEIKAMGRRALSTKCDVTRYAECEAMVNNAIRQLGKVDILVNNAGGGPREKATDFRNQSEEQWDFFVRLNLYGMRHCTRAVINHMIERKAGKIVNIASHAGVLPRAPRLTEYVAAKAGVIGFTRSLAAEVGGFGVYVNCVAPGATETRAMKFYPADVTEAPTRIIRRHSQPEEQAQAVLFLASDDSNYIMGQCLSVDGGLKV